MSAEASAHRGRSGIASVRALPELRSIAGPVALVVGSFDGVHLGHRKLLGRARAEARRIDGRSLALTFDPHPRCLVDPHGCPCSLSSLDERLRLLHEAGADEVRVLAFTPALSRWSAEHFCSALVDAVEVRALVGGPGFALGHDREGDLDFLRRYGRSHGFSVCAVGPALHGRAPVSSTRIRAVIAAGRVGEARAMLGRRYELSGRVVRGVGRGRELGFPTANLEVGGACLPASGVYATRLRIGGAAHPAATSVGTRPTFDGTALTVEAHVLGFTGDLYGERVGLVFERRLREDRRFSSAGALVARMRRDVAAVERTLARATPP